MSHPSLLGHIVHTRVYVYSMNTKRKDIYPSPPRARPNGRNFASSSAHVDARARDDERAMTMTRRGPSVDDELGELRVRDATATARNRQRETMRSHGIV